MGGPGARRGRGRGAASSRGRGRGAVPSESSSGDDDDDDDVQMEDADAGTPPPAGTRLAALGEKDLPRLVERYAALSFHLPKKARNFKPEDARLKLNQHVERWGLGKSEPTARGQQGGGAASAAPGASPLAGCELRQDMTDKMLHKLLALPYLQRKNTIFASGVGVVNEQLDTRNFLEQPLVYMNDDVHMPDAADTTPRPSAAAGPAQPRADADLLLPPEMPHLPRSKPAAAIIVQQMEEQVEVEGVGVYSPMRLWTVVARRPHEKLHSQTTLFGRRCRLYLYILSLKVDPASLAQTATELLKGLEAWQATLSDVQKQALDWDEAARVAGERVAADRLAGLGGGS